MRSRVPMVLLAWSLACGGGDPAISPLDPGGRPGADASDDAFVTPDGAVDAARDTTVPADPGGKPDAWPGDLPGVLDVPGTDLHVDVPPDEDAVGVPDVPPDANCVPQCGGRECGDDGCGGSCGPCDSLHKCEAGVCVCAPQPYQAYKACCSAGNDVCWYDSCGVEQVVAEACGVACKDGQCVACAPSCGGRECGSDGCDGACGACEGEALCVAGRCVSTEPCTGVPQSWSPAGLVTSLQTPAAGQMGACFDYDDDGKGDNALAGVADLMNPYIQPTAAGMVFEFAGVKDFANAASFPLNVLRGTASGPGGAQVRLDRGSYDGACHPWTSLPASIQASVLSAGPGVFVLILPFGTGSLTFVLQDALFSGKVLSGGPGGVALSDGVLGGVLTQAELDNTMALAAEQCSGPGAPTFCTYLDMLPGLIPMELDLNGDGVLDAAPLCFRYALKAVRVVGYL